jgi:hypothetical protein
LGDPAFRIAAEDHSHPLQIHDVAGRFAAHGLDRVLIAEIETTLDGIERMRFPRVVGPECGIDATLRGNRMTADRMDLGENGYVKVGTVSECCERGPHPGKAGADDKDIVDLHAARSAIMTGIGLRE